MRSHITFSFAKDPTRDHALLSVVAAKNAGKDVDAFIGIDACEDEDMMVFHSIASEWSSSTTQL